MATMLKTSFVIICVIMSCITVVYGRGQERPNILILHVDQWRAQSFGYAGDKEVKTPNIDALEADSANFQYAVSSLPVCTPARASTLTGQRPLTNGVFMNDVRLNPEAVTLAEVLDKAGYQTGYIGKWHLDGNDRRSFTPPGPRRQGFEYWKALNCTHSYNHSAYYDNNDREMKFWKGYDVFAQGRDAMDYITSHSQDNNPFFLMLSWGPPHDPYGIAPQNYKDMFRLKDLTARPNVPDEMKAKSLKSKLGYYSHMAAIDETVGKIVASLKKDNLYDKTIILFTSDHGDLLGSHGLFGKQAPWDESIRVPMLVHLSGSDAITTGVYDAMITCEDIMPTVLGLCNVTIPQTVEGKDFSKYLRGGENPKEDVADILCVQPFSARWSHKAGGMEYRGIRTQRYTYARNLKGPWILYDNHSDPYQMHNLVDDVATSAVKTRLNGILTKRLEVYKDPFLPGPAMGKKYGYPAFDAKGGIPYTR